MNKKFPSMVLHHISMNVNNYDACMNFYLGLGMKLYCQWEWEEDLYDYNKGCRSCFIDVGNGACIELNEVRAENKANGLIQHYCLYLDTSADVDAVYQAALELGAESIIAPFDQQLMCSPKPILKSRVAHVYGPAGEQIEIISWNGYNPYE